MKQWLRLCAVVAVAAFITGEYFNGPGTLTAAYYAAWIAAATAVVAVLEIGVVMAAHHWAWRRKRRLVIEITRVQSPNGGMASEASSHLPRSADRRVGCGGRGRPLAHVGGHDQIHKRIRHIGGRFP